MMLFQLMILAIDAFAKMKTAWGGSSKSKPVMSLGFST